MYDYFYHFHNRNMANDLFNRFDEEGTPPAPPILFALLDNDGNDLLDNNSVILTDNG